MRIFALLFLLSSGSAFAADNVVTFCNCVDNNGPDLILYGLEANTGRELWTKKLAGWNSNDQGWTACWQRLEIVCKTVR